MKVLSDVGDCTVEKQGLIEQNLEALNCNQVAQSNNLFVSQGNNSLIA